MAEMDLLNILDDLTDNEFENFKWSLKYEKVGDITPIKESQLEKAERRNVVDLMVQKYEFAGAVEVTKSVLKKISRNHLVTKLPTIGSGAEGQLQNETNVESLTDSRSVRRSSLCLYLSIILDKVHGERIWTVTQLVCPSVSVLQHIL